MEKVSGARIALKWGLILGLITIIHSAIEYSTELWKLSFINFTVSLILLFTVLYFAFKEFKSLNSGYMRLGEGVNMGALISATFGILNIFFVFLYKKFIDPSLIKQGYELSTNQQEEIGIATDKIKESIATQMQWEKSGITFFISVIAIILAGLICSLIMSAIMKKEKSIFE